MNPSFKHGHAPRGRHSPTYTSWHAMKRRCSNRNGAQWKDYGGRGISVCARWMSFENFLDDMGERPLGLTLDRIDGRLGYGPENCRWIDRKTQRINTRGKSNSTSKFKGVCWISREKKWVAQIMVNGKNRQLGAFLDERLAAKTYDRAAFAAWGSDAFLNFPKKDAA